MKLLKSMVVGQMHLDKLSESVCTTNNSSLNLDFGLWLEHQGLEYFRFSFN